MWLASCEEPKRKMDGPDLSKLIYLLIIGGIVAGIGFYSIRICLLWQGSRLEKQIAGG